MPMTYNEYERITDALWGRIMAYPLRDSKTNKPLTPNLDEFNDLNRQYRQVVNDYYAQPPAQAVAVEVVS